jgi:hypothetical protein
VLVSEPPAKAQVVPTGPYATEFALGSRLDANLVVDPAAAGPNQIHVYLLGGPAGNKPGRPVEVSEVQVGASLPSRRIGPLRLEAHRAGPGHFIVTGAHLAIPGDWQIELEVRRGAFDLLTKTVSVPIRREK